MAENPPALGALIREKRERDGLNLREAGKASGVAFSTLGRVENGGDPSLKVDRLIRAWLCGETPTLPTPPMTLRDWFAGQALPAVIRSTAAGQHHPVKFKDGATIIEAMAFDAYALADALLTEREKPRGDAA